MKINIEIDCTPEEARAALGLPDLKPMQDAMTAELEERMRTAMQSLDAEALMKMWAPFGSTAGSAGGTAGVEQLQKAFWSQMTSGMGAPKPSD